MSAAPTRTGFPNLIAFVAATMGRVGRFEDVPGGIAVASAVPVANGYVNAAFRTDDSVAAPAFVAGALAFFASRSLPFVAWAPAGDTELIDELVAAGGTPDEEGHPMMSIGQRLPVTEGLTVRAAISADDRSVFGRLCEEGYEKPGLAWLLDHHRSYEATGTVWAVATESVDNVGGGGQEDGVVGGVDVGVGCGYLEGATGGIYYVATPAQFRRRGAGAAITSWLVNHLLDGGAAEVTLQASAAGFPVYERLGFRTVSDYRCIAFGPAT